MECVTAERLLYSMYWFLILLYKLGLVQSQQFAVRMVTVESSQSGKVKSEMSVHPVGRRNVLCVIFLVLESRTF